MALFQKGHSPHNKGRTKDNYAPLKSTSEKQKISMKGKHNSPQTQFKKGNLVNLGRTHSTETRLIISQKKYMGGHITKNGYRVIKYKGKNTYEHVFVWLRDSDMRFLPKGWDIHHKNGNKLDNRIENLQAVPKELHTIMHHCVRGTT